MSEITAESVRAEARAWLEENWNPDQGLVEWRNKLAGSGWGAPHWPKEWHGRDLPVGMVPVVDEEFDRIGAVGVASRCWRRRLTMARFASRHVERLMSRHRLVLCGRANSVGPI